MSKVTPGTWEVLEVGDRPTKKVIAANNESLLTLVEEGDSVFAAVFNDKDAILMANAKNMYNILVDLYQTKRGMLGITSRVIENLIDAVK